MVIQRGDNSGSNFSVVHKTEVIKNTLDPTWKMVELPLGQLIHLLLLLLVVKDSFQEDFVEEM